MSFLQILILALVQGAAELLPVSSSAHVITAEKLMGLDPTSPQMTMLLVMLHTGTMFAVILYFWKQWKAHFFGSREELVRTVRLVLIATVCTGVLGLILKAVIEHGLLKGDASGNKAEIERLFGDLRIIAAALFGAGVLIIVASLKRWNQAGRQDLNPVTAAIIGLVQGICLPFRGFSRSGATISTGLILGIPRFKAEEFSFALAVVLTPPVIAREGLRLMKHHSADAAQAAQSVDWGAVFFPSLLGMVLSFLAGLMALRWLSSWLEKGRWHWFGAYCLIASVVIFWLYQAGY